MQITLNQAEVSQVVLEYIQNQLALDDSNNFTVELHEDGITVLVNEDSTGSTGQPSTGEKPVKKPRRTKAQIEADNKLEAERQAALTTGKSNDTPTQTLIVQGAQLSEPVVVEAAGDASQTVKQGPGADVVDPELAAELAAASAEEDAAADAELDPVTPAANQEPEPELQPEPVVEETPKPTTSLFANLRRPKN